MKNKIKISQEPTFDQQKFFNIKDWAYFPKKRIPKNTQGVSGRGVSHSWEISGNPYEAEIAFENWQISYAKCWSDLPLVSGGMNMVLSLFGLQTLRPNFLSRKRSVLQTKILKCLSGMGWSNADKKFWLEAPARTNDFLKRKTGQK